MQKLIEAISVKEWPRYICSMMYKKLILYVVTVAAVKLIVRLKLNLFTFVNT